MKKEENNTQNQGSVWTLQDFEEGMRILEKAQNDPVPYDVAKKNIELMIQWGYKIKV